MGLIRRFVDRNRTPDYVDGDDQGPLEDLAASVRSWVADGITDRNRLFTQARREADDAAPYLSDDEVAAIVDRARLGADGHEAQA